MPTLCETETCRPSKVLKDCSKRDNCVENITTNISHIKPTGEVEQDWNETKTVFCDSIKETVGFKWKTMSKRNQNIWWNEEVKDAVKVKDRLFRIWMKERTPETRASYIAARNDNLERRPKEAKQITILDIQEKILEQSV